MIGIQAGREAYKERKIDNMGWVKSSGNLADGVTKIKKLALIQLIMRTGKSENVADHWVIWSPINSDSTAPGNRATSCDDTTNNRSKNGRYILLLCFSSFPFLLSSSSIYIILLFYHLYPLSIYPDYYTLSFTYRTIIHPTVSSLNHL